MARRTARLQVPIDQDELGKLHDLATQLGFDSVPAMIRFWAKGEIAKNSRERGLSSSNAIVLRYIELILALNPEPADAESALNYLFNKLRHTKFRQFFKDLPQGPTSDTIFDT